THDFSEYDYHLEFIPLQIQPVETSYMLTPELFKLSIPPKSLLRQYYRHGEFQEISLQPGTSLPYGLDFVLPPQFAGSIVQEVKIELDISDPSGRASLDIWLIDVQGKRLEADRREGLSFYFKPKSQVLDSRENRIRTQIYLNYRGNDEVSTSQRINNWRIISCKMQMQADKPHF
ncbi:MAG: hypothetical protein GX946_01660, partial [Oligosphaeraceae bacterium]|nr:hypothetical protein [Oligosphaeraceae bacterium]